MMLRLADFPPEIVLSVLSFLPVPALSSFRQTSQQWNSFFLANEAHIYRNASYHHSFIPTPEVLLENASKEREKTWYQLCRGRYTLEGRWIGQQRPWFKTFGGKVDDVYRFKMDEKRGILMTTHKHGGLIVRDLETDEILWALPRTYVRRYARLEYGGGFLVFDRSREEKEVWRLTAEYDESPAPPEEFQQRISFRVNEHIPQTKGSFKPWAVLTLPEHSQAYRMVYPNLLVVGAENAYIQNIITCEPAQVISDDTPHMYHINHVESSPLHVVICGRTSIWFFDKHTGGLAFSIQRETLTNNFRHQITFDFSHNYTRPTSDFRVIPLTPRRDAPIMDATLYFIAAHTSPDGKTIAVLTSNGSLIIIKDILSVLKGQQNLLDPNSSIVLSLCETPDGYPQLTHGVHLAFEHGRIGVITTSGVFAVTLDATRHNLVGRDEAIKQRLTDLECNIESRRVIANSPFPYIRCCQVLPFQHETLLKEVTCLQMTETKMLFTYYSNAMPGLMYYSSRSLLHAWDDEMHAGASQSEGDEGDEEDMSDDAQSAEDSDDEDQVVDLNAPGDDEDLEENDATTLVPVRVRHQSGNESVIACLRFSGNIDGA